MWSSLSNSQLDRQSSFLEKSNNIGAYILLGTSWFEYQSSTDLPGIKIGYEELITGINKIITTTTYSSDIHELSLAYRNTFNYYQNWDYNYLYFDYNSGGCSGGGLFYFGTGINF